jgi:hypothetical protein
MKAMVLCILDIDPGASANDLTLLADVRFVGTEAEIPGRVLNALGANGNGVPIPIAINNLAGYPNAAEDALIAEAVRLGLPALGRTDCIFPNFTRGA